jgi:hypothetical protein
VLPEVKSEQRVLDFADLEWQAYRLLNDEASAAYLQTRLDARYKHILLDEFQDTNPLQWSIVRSWLRAYGDDAAQPSVFVVGDPKQSIYRFRRAEPRVFVAARDLLRAQGAPSCAPIRRAAMPVPWSRCSTTPSSSVAMPCSPARPRWDSTAAKSGGCPWSSKTKVPKTAMPMRPAPQLRRREQRSAPPGATR